MNNFQLFLELKKPEHDHRDDRQQDLYTAVTCRPRKGKDLFGTEYTVTLTRTDNTEVKVDPEPLLSCVRGSRIPIRDIKIIKANLWEAEDWMWDVFSLITSLGAVIERIHCNHWGDYLEENYPGTVVYSPVIHEMIEQGKLLRLR